MLAGLKKVLLVAGLFPAVMATPATAQPSVSIMSPGPDQILPGPDVRVDFRVLGAALRPGGNNVHFMLDNEQFEVQFDAAHPHVFKDVAPGTHTIRAYLANRQHEAIRGSLAMVTFSVSYCNTANRPEPGRPMLTFNLPQGEYLGIDTADITVDYLVSNVSLSPGGAKVAYYVDGRRFFAHDGMPKHVTDLRAGHHVFRIELQDEHGDLIDGPFNSVERTILLSPDSSVNSPGVTASKYPPTVPRISSIHGAMTNGNPSVAVENPRKMTADQVRRSQTLTVRHGETQAADVESETETRTTTEHTEVMEAPEVTTEETHSRTSLTQTDDSIAREATPAEVTEETRTETRRETPLTTSGRRLDNRLERTRDVPGVSMVRADAPSTGGRSVLRRIKVPTTETTGTVRKTSGTTDTASTAAAVASTPVSATTAVTVTPSPSPSPSPNPTLIPSVTPVPASTTPVPKPGEETPMPTYAPGQTAPTPAAPAEDSTEPTTSTAPGIP